MFDKFFNKDSNMDAENSYNEFMGAKDKGEHKGHPKTAGAVAFMAMKAYDHKAKKEGKKPIGTMKEILASLAVAEVDKLVEEKAIPAAEAKYHKEKAIKHAHAMADERCKTEGGDEY